MDSQDEFQEILAEIDRELEEYRGEQEKSAGLYDDEVPLIQSWQQNPTQEGFMDLYGRHRNLIERSVGHYRSSTLPRPVVNSFALRRYTHALQTYDPGRGAAFNTHLFRDMQRVGRMVNDYANIGRIPTERARYIDLVISRELALEDELGRKPTDTELTDDILLSTQDREDIKDGAITQKMVSTLRSELRPDYVAELAGGESAPYEDSSLQRKIKFLHDSLNREQQLVLEHTYDGFGKDVIDSAEDLALRLNMSPQKIRALRKQIRERVEDYYGPLGAD